MCLMFYINEIPYFYILQQNCNTIVRQYSTTNSNKGSLMKTFLTSNSEITLDDSIFLVAGINKEGLITFVNEDLCETSGYSVDELIGKPFNTLSHGDMPKSILEDIAQDIINEKQWQGFIKCKTKDSFYYWTFSMIVPVKGDANHNFLCFSVKPTDDEIKKALSLHEKLNLLAELE